MENQRNSGSLSKKQQKPTKIPAHLKVLFYLCFIGKVKQKRQNGALWGVMRTNAWNAYEEVPFVQMQYLITFNFMRNRHEHFCGKVIVL